MYSEGVMWFPSSSFKLIFNIVYWVLKLYCYMGFWKEDRWKTEGKCFPVLLFSAFSERELCEAITRPANHLLKEDCYALCDNVWLAHGLKALSFGIGSIERYSSMKNSSKGMSFFGGHLENSTDMLGLHLV